MLYDILEDSPAFRELRNKGRQDLIVKMSLVQTLEEARQQLLDVVENEDEDE